MKKIKIDKAQKEKILIIVLLVVFVSMFAGRLIKTGSGTKERKPLMPARIRAREAEASKEAPSQRTAVIEYTGANERDPFRLPHQVSSAVSALSQGTKQGEVSLKPKTGMEITGPSELSLQGIIWGEKVPQAIINGEVLKKGDSISGMEIIDIQKKKVRLIYQGKEFEIAFPGGK